MANKSYYVDQSFNTVHTASDYADIQKRLAEDTEAQGMYKQFYSAAADVNKYYDELLRKSQGTTKRSMFEQKNVAGATGALGLNKYEQAVNAKFNSAFGEIQTDRAKSLATINKQAEEFESYIGESSAGLSEYIINWYQNAGVDPNTWSADFSSSSAADMLREGYVAYDTDVKSKDYGSLVVTDKWRDAMAQFFRGDYMAGEFGAEKGKAAGQTGATYRMENLRTYNKDLYDFASTYRKTYIDLESGDVQGIINKSYANVDTYADAYNTAKSNEAMEKLFGSQDVPKPGLNKTYGYIKDTSKLDSEQRAAYLDKKQAVLGYVANSGLQLSDNGQRVTNFANGTTFTIDGTTFTVSEPSPSDFEFGTAGSKTYGGVAKIGEQANLRLSTRKTDWYDGTAGTTVSLGTAVNAGKIKAGDVIFVDNNYYLVTRADPDPDKKKKGGRHAADVRLTRVIPT